MSGSVLVVGSSGSAHALAWKLADSAVVGGVESAPGNPGMARLGPCHQVDVDDTTAVAELAARLALVTNEGRVLTVTGRGSDLDQARAVAYAAADEISFDGLQRRSDIGLTRAAG